MHRFCTTAKANGPYVSRMHRPLPWTNTGRLSTMLQVLAESPDLASFNLGMPGMTCMCQLQMHRHCNSAEHASLCGIYVHQGFAALHMILQSTQGCACRLGALGAWGAGCNSQSSQPALHNPAPDSPGCRHASLL